MTVPHSLRTCLSSPQPPSCHSPSPQGRFWARQGDLAVTVPSLSQHLRPLPALQLRVQAWTGERAGWARPGLEGDDFRQVCPSAALSLRLSLPDPPRLPPGMFILLLGLGSSSFLVGPPRTLCCPDMPRPRDVDEI